ncbi:MAG: TonB family protein [Ignavibacteriales bacterium]|nr:TonB family protein [Ignavibacteriales bacterium]
MYSKFILILTILFTCLSISKAQDGLVRSYYSTGNLESAIYYINDVLDGTSRFFYEDGVLKEEKTYSMGKLHGWIKTYWENGAQKEEFYVKDGVKDGISKEFYINDGLKLLKIYDVGRLKRSQFVEYDSSLAPPNRESIRSLANTKEQIKKLNEKDKKILPDPVESIVFGNKKEIDKEPTKEIYYTLVDEFPKPTGGPSEIFSKAVYPEYAKENKIEGIVIIRTFIDENGTPVKTEVVKGIGYGCDEAAMDAIKLTKFSSPKINGKPVKFQLLIPVKFRIN